MRTQQIDGQLFAEMIQSGAATLAGHVSEVNDLNVFPIPDGDTGENMMLTMNGGLHTFASSSDVSENLSETAQQISRGMLLGARGNSGVILSQFFAGIAEGLKDVPSADAASLSSAFKMGVRFAYDSVMTPTEGTILTVIRDAASNAENASCSDCTSFMEEFLKEAKEALLRTPEQLPVLREAGVVDSGGAGLVYIAEGMKARLNNESSVDTSLLETFAQQSPAASGPMNLDLFDETMTLEFGYCTELLVRLQNSKTDPETFDVETLKAYLQTIGNSIVAFKTGSIVKIHVHTMTPQKVLDYCQQYGEFLTLKIENMMLQHNEVIKDSPDSAAASMSSGLTPPDTVSEKAAVKEVRKHKAIGIVTVASGEGIKEAFLNFGADEVISGGQTMNPSAQDFLQAFDRIGADHLFVLPNNGNIILAAQQAAGLYPQADVRIIPTKSIGDAWAILSMMDTGITDPDEFEEALLSFTEGVQCAEISQSIRSASLQDLQIETGDYLGIEGKKILCCDKSLEGSVLKTAEALNPDEHGLMVVIAGKDTDEELTARILDTLRSAHPFTEFCDVAGGQEVYHYILIAE